MAEVLTNEEINSLFEKIDSKIIENMNQNEIDRMLSTSRVLAADRIKFLKLADRREACTNNNEKAIDLFSVDFFDIEYWASIHCWLSNDMKIMLSDKILLIELLDQAKEITINENESNQKRAEALIRAYQLLFINYYLAFELLNYALILVADMSLVYVNMGIHYSFNKDMGNTFKYLNKAIEVDPSYPYSWLVKGDLEKNRNNRLFCYSEFIKLKPNLEIGYTRRITLIDDKIYNIKSIKDQFDNLKFVKQLIKDNAALINLNKPGLYLNNCLAIFHNWFQKGLKDNVIDLLDKIIDLFAKNTTEYWIAQVIYADTIMYSPKHEIANEKYGEIINADTASIIIKKRCYYNRYHNYLRFEKYEKALDDNTMLLELYLKSPKMKYGYGENNLIDIRTDRIEILKNLREFDKVIQEYSYILEELKKEENDIYRISETYMNRAKYYLKNNEDEKALEDYSKVIELGVNGLKPNVKNAYTARIEIFKKRGEMEKAFADFIKMSELKKYDRYSDPYLQPEDFHMPQYKIIE